MAEYWDVVQWHESRNGKNFTTYLGSALQNEKGHWNLYMKALPIPQKDGECKITVQPKRQKKPGDGDF